MLLLAGIFFFHFLLFLVFLLFCLQRIHFQLKNEFIAFFAYVVDGFIRLKEMMRIEDLCMVKGTVETVESFALKANSLHFTSAFISFAIMNMGWVHYNKNQ